MLATGVSTATVTPIPCFPQKPTTDLERIAETWFLSSVPQIPERKKYEFVGTGEAWAIICSQYQNLLLTNEKYDPIEISLQVVTQSAGQDYYQMDSVIVAAINSDHLVTNSDLDRSMKDRNIVTVVVSHPSFDVQVESRADYIYENKIWQIRWLGYRWKCINITDPEWRTGKVDCP